MKLKKIFIRTAVVIFFLFVATISGIFIFHKPILNYIQKKAFKYALARVHREFKDLIIKVKNYEFDWDNRRIIVEGIYLNSKTGLDGFISKIIFQFDFSDKLYPVSEIKIFDINLYTSADFKVLLDKLKNLKIEPDTSNSTFFVKNIKVNKINAVLYDTFSDIKYRWRDIEVNLCFKYKQVEKLHIDSGKFSFLILNKGILSLLEKQKLASGLPSEITVFDDSIFEYSANSETSAAQSGFILPYLSFVAKNKKTVAKLSTSRETNFVFDLINVPIKLPKKEVILNFTYNCSIMNFEGTGRISVDGMHVNFEYLNNMFKVFENKNTYFVYDFNKKEGLSLNIDKLDVSKYFFDVSGFVGVKLDLMENEGLFGSKIFLNIERFRYQDYSVDGKIDVELGLLQKNKIKPINIKLKSGKLTFNNYNYKINFDCVYDNYELTLKKLQIYPYKPIIISDYTVNSFIESDTGVISFSREFLKLSTKGNLTNLLGENHFEIKYGLLNKKIDANYNMDNFRIELSGKLDGKIISSKTSVFSKDKLISSIDLSYNLEENSFFLETGKNEDLRFLCEFKGLSDINFDFNMNEKFLKSIGIKRNIDSFSSYLKIKVDKSGINYNGKILYSEKEGSKFLGYINGLNNNLNIEKLIYEMDKTGINLSGTVKINFFEKKLKYRLNNHVNNLNIGTLKFNGNLIVQGDADLLNSNANCSVYSNDISVNNSDLDTVCLKLNFNNNNLIFIDPDMNCWGLKGNVYIGKNHSSFYTKNIYLLKNGKNIATVNGFYDLSSKKIKFKYTQLSSDLSTLAYYTDILRKIDGTGSFYIEIENTIDNPVINAELILKNVNLYLTDYVKEIKNINGSIKINNNEVYFDNIKGDNYKGYVLLTSDTGSNINNLNVNLFATKIFVEVPEVELTAQADIKGKLIGTIRKPVVKGDAFVSNAQFTYPPIKPQKSSKFNPEGIYPFWDANVHIRENVRYKYLTVEIELDKGASLYFKGTKFDISVKGFLSAHAGKVPYLNRKFDLVLAEMIVNSEAGIPVVTGECGTLIDGLEIKLNYSGPVDKFNPIFRAPSRPELTQEEVLKIVRIGTIGTLTATGRTVDAENDYGVYKFVDSNISAIIGKPIEERLLKDFKLYFNLNAPFVENIVKSNESSDSEKMSHNLLLNTSVSVGKYLFKDLYFEYRGKVVNVNQNSVLSNDIKTGWQSELEAKYNLKKNAFFKYRYSPSIEKDKEAEHFILFEKMFKF